MTEVAGPDDIEPIYTELGRRVAALRKERGLTQESLSDRAGVSANYLARTEGGYHRPNLARLEGIAEALEVSVASLFTSRPAPASASVLPTLLAELEKLPRDDQHLLLQLVKRLNKGVRERPAGYRKQKRPRGRREP
jgi:transcriptional regulator with XRE-family HTH domain